MSVTPYSANLTPKHKNPVTESQRRTSWGLHGNEVSSLTAAGVYKSRHRIKKKHKDAERRCALNPVMYHAPGERQDKKLINGLCCKIKCACERRNDLAAPKMAKTCERQPNKKSSRQPRQRIGKYPVVNLCNMSNVFKFPPKFERTGCILPKELKTHSFRCFKDCTVINRTHAKDLRSSHFARNQRLNVNPGAPTRPVSDVTSNGHRKRHKNGMVKKTKATPEDDEWQFKFRNILGEFSATAKMEVPSCVGSKCEKAASLGSAGSSVSKAPSGRQERPAGVVADEGRLSEELCEDDELTEIGGHGFSCQRTTAYQPCASCARTYISWPFRRPVSTVVERGVSALGSSTHHRCKGHSVEPSTLDSFKIDIASPALKGDNNRGVVTQYLAFPEKELCPLRENEESSLSVSSFSDSGARKRSRGSTSQLNLERVTSQMVSQSSSLNKRVIPQTSLPTATIRSSSSGEDSGNTNNLSSDEGLEDYSDSLNNTIMCEMPDESTRLGSSRNGDVWDLAKAYEQDAIVLDVIHDDPELFGKVWEESKVTKSEITPKQTVPANMPAKRNQQCRFKDDKISNKLGMSSRESEDQKISVRWKEEKKPSACRVHGLWGEADAVQVKDSKHEPAQMGTSLQEFSNTVSSSCINGFQISQNGRVTDETSASHAIRLNHRLYCKYYFSKTHSCFRKACWFLHVPVKGDEEFCFEVVQNFIRDSNLSLLQRAAAVFVSYYQKCPPGAHFNTAEFESLLWLLFNNGFVREVLSILRVVSAHKIPPPAQLLMALFGHVTKCGLVVMAADLISITSMCVDAGLLFTAQHFEYIQNCLERLHLPQSQMNMFVAVKLRVLGRDNLPVKVDFPIPVVEIERCKEQEDWARLATVFSDLCVTHWGSANLQQVGNYITLVLLKETPPSAPPPFCQFVHAVYGGSFVSDFMRNLLGRMGISLMFKYYELQQWKKGQQLLDILTRLQISYTTMHGLFENEAQVSRCRLVSVAAEVYLNSGDLDGALTTLNNNDWIVSSSFWPCDNSDIQHRVTVQCQLLEATAQRCLYKEMQQILTRLPGLQDPADSLDITLYNEIFNRYLTSLMENLTASSSLVEFMLQKNITVDWGLLRILIHKLGKNSIWLKARSLYKSAMSIGCYPHPQANKYCWILSVHHFLTEIEMVISMEMFMVSCAEEVHSSPQTPQVLQIVLKRNGMSEQNVESDYQAAGQRLLSAAQILNPKLVVKYATVNLCQEQVFTLDAHSVHKWLNQNLAGAAKVWLRADLHPSSNDRFL